MADQLDCERCGGALPARLLAPELTCPHCGHRQRIDPAALADLERYRDEAARDLAEADAHRRDARTQRATTRRMGLTQQIVMVFVAPMIIATSLVALVSILHGAGFFDVNAMTDGQRSAIGAGIAFISVAGFVVALAFVLVSSFRSARSPSSAPRTDAAPIQAPVSSTVLCPRCGGPNALHAGVATESCHYCGGTFAPDEAARAEGLDASERTRREAALARYRQERTLIAGFGSQNQAHASMPPTVIGAIIPGVIGPIICLGSGFGAVQTVTKAEEHPWSGLLGGACVGFVLIAIAGAFGWLTVKKKRAGDADKERAASAYGGTPIRGLVATARWLSQHWAGPYDLTLFHGATKGYLGAEGWRAGYPWLFELEPEGPKARAQVLVAAFHADRPAVETAPDDVRRVFEELRGAGAEVTLDEAGARAIVDPSTASPQRISHLRDQLVYAVARVGGRPLG